MEQLVMKAIAPYKEMTRTLPNGYKFVLFKNCEKDINDWKNIIMNTPAPLDGADSCYHLMIEIYPDIIKEQDIHFIENNEGERVATITTITHKDKSGYVHMVKAKESERGKGLGKVMAQYSLQVFKKRNIDKVILTTDDFRLPAIKTYLDAGFLPVVHGNKDSEINKRWDKVLENLNYPAVEKIERAENEEFH